LRLHPVLTGTFGIRRSESSMNYLVNRPSVLARTHSPARGPRPFAFKRSAQCRLARALSLALFAAPALAAEATPADPQSPQTWAVQTCDDVTGPGSLRYIAAHALSGDTIDFSQLPMLCGMRDSTITLSSGEIVLHQGSITLEGPLPEDGTVTLSGAGASRILKHQGYSPYTGTLTISNLRFVDGYVHEMGSTGGGCMMSDAHVYMQFSSVTDCAVVSDTGGANGGGLWAANGNTILKSSEISGNSVAIGTNDNARGGGICSHTVVAKYSQIENNLASGGVVGFGEGGGISADAASISYSSVINNSATTWGGGFFAPSGNLTTRIRNSTFSENHSDSGGGGIFVHAANFYLDNSTIAENSIDGGHGGGVYASASNVEIQSTIIATNTSAGMSNDADFYLKSGVLTGSSNAIMSSNINLPNFIAVDVDPKLGPLAWIGGHTKTHSLLSGSPVIGLGNNPANASYEQRGVAYPRATGPTSSVDIGAVQFDDRIFFSGLDRFFF
jgi:hypothetical protein